MDTGNELFVLWSRDQQKAWPFSIENISVVQAPLLKIYYWESLDIEGLNKKLDAVDESFEHDFYIPPAQINSCQLRIVFWLRDRSEDGTCVRIKRIQNCGCVAHSTRVGFNQYRKLYHCPHRHLVSVNQELIKMKSGELVALSFVIYFYYLGENKLSFEISCGGFYTLRLHFHVNIVSFDAEKCLITKDLIPVEMSEPRRFVQALWVRNITMQDLKFKFSTKSRGLKMINCNLTVPRQSVWPLMVEFRPTGYEDNLHVMQIFDNTKTVHKIGGRGYLGCVDFNVDIPVLDLDCERHRYIVYPNRIEFNVGPEEERSLLVNIHNFSKRCVEFHWQNYVINNLFSITYEPETFRLKAHHSKLCIINLRSYDRPLHFVRVPLVLEVHRIFDHNVQLAKDLLSEIESIDDPKWKQESYMQHVLVQLDLKINFKPRPSVDLKYERLSFSPTQNLWTCEVPMKKTPSITIFEKIFWEYLSQSNFMRANKNPEIGDRLSYSQFFDFYRNPPCVEKPSELSKNTVLKLISKLLFQGIHGISKNWVFVPTEPYERPL